MKRLKRENLSSFAIKGTDEEWGKALASNKSTLISVKSGEHILGEAKGWDELVEPQAKKKKFGKQQGGGGGGGGSGKKNKGGKR